MDNTILAVIKTEQPEVDLESPEINSSSQSCSPIIKQDLSNKHIFHAKDFFKLVKQELPDTLYEDTSHEFSNILGTVSCGSFQERTGNSSTGLRATEKDLKLSFNGVHLNHRSVNESSVGEINRSPSLTSENLQFHNKKTRVKHVEISGRSDHVTVDIPSSNAHKTLAPYMSEGCDTNVSAEMKIPVVETSHSNSNCDVAFNEFSFRKVYKCDDCGASFTRNDQMIQHKRTHTGEKPYKCDVCGGYFSQASSLHYHKRTHSGEKPHKCEVCPASFTRSDYLTRHKRKHTGEKPFECDVCGVSFTQASHVNRHKRTHTGEKPYKCDVCGAFFTEAGSLTQHMRTHTGERPYKCDVCGVSFTKASNLNCHIKTHTGEKPYKCDVCGASFTKASNLNCHVRTHTGEKPYKCDVCGTCFTRNDHLTYHKKKHNRET